MPTDEQQEPADKPEPNPDDLGDGGKKALDAERKARRDAEAEAKNLKDRLAAIEDKDKTEVERLTAQVAQLTKDLDTATVNETRLRVAISKGMSEDKAARLLGAAKRITGATPEELEADADDYFSLLGEPPAEGEGKKDPPPGGKPREQLKPGNGDPDIPVEETDIKKLGARMFGH